MLTSVLFIAVALIALMLLAWRWFDHHADRQAINRLVTTQPKRPARFDPAMLAELPEPARRFFLYAIASGTPLYTVANITMTGQFGMGTKADPKYLEMIASQTLAAPDGFVWKMRARRGLMSLSGSDSERWTRFWLMGLLPVAHLGGDLDHKRSAFGRYVAEAVFWTPAALLPGPGIHWEPVDADCARVTLSHQGLSQAVDVTVSPEGQPTFVSFQRWSNANSQKLHRLQPFGGYLAEFREFSGFRLPTKVEAGNNFGTDQYFPFFVANIENIDFPNDTVE